MQRDEIGYCVWVLHHKIWGKVPVDGRLRSQHWWRQRLDAEINKPTIEINPEYLKECYPAEPAPVPYEVEFHLANAGDCVDWLLEQQRRLT